MITNITVDIAFLVLCCFAAVQQFKRAMRTSMETRCFIHIFGAGAWFMGAVVALVFLCLHIMGATL